MHGRTEFHQRFARTDGGIDRPSAAQKTGLESGAHSSIVVDHQHLAHPAAPACVFVEISGKVILNTAPVPCFPEASIVPLCCSTILLHTLSPRPGLPSRMLNPGVKIFSRYSGAIPGPVSRTV